MNCVPDQPEQQDDLQYASVHFSNNRADPLYSNMRAAEPLGHTEQQEVPEYAAVKFSSAAPRRKRASRDSSEPEERADNREECVPDQPEQQDDLQYASVHFSNNRADPLYSNMRAAEPLRHTEQQEVSEYAAVKFSSAAPRTRGQDSEEDPAALYSTVNKSR
ncbi:hypothetical protein F7725_006187 [Dissostichus mawsoni]|uniref:Uncharacterized protein n=1 Tax=Dissostichus mawsoni TaxID=36200 RepID=A0A7J5YTB4_DISMA|nr:hypothetical protein F7725_006187 [Dissostichus mawsoni]